MGATTAVFAVCFGFWFLLTDRYTLQSFVFAAAAAAAVALANRDLLVLSAALPALPRVLLYLPWLLKEIIVANLQVVRLVLDPRLPIDPIVVRFEPPLTSDLALTTLGNSITLTPGTVTLDVEGRTLVVHALTRAGAEAVLEGAMARRVGKVFGDPGA